MSQNKGFAAQLAARDIAEGLALMIRWSDWSDTKGESFDEGVIKLRQGLDSALRLVSAGNYQVSEPLRKRRSRG